MNVDPHSPKSGAADGPTPWVVRHANRIVAGGRVLDLACGRGRNARWLAGEGFRVLAVDRDRAALAMPMSDAVEVRCLDLEAPQWPLAGEVFDGVVVTRYLYRPRFAELVALLAPGGVLIHETFMRGNEAFGSPRRPEFLLEAGELERVARSFGLAVIEFREGIENGARAMVTQSLCARRV
jgi:SAM-dependent methyltransferase